MTRLLIDMACTLIVMPPTDVYCDKITFTSFDNLKTNRHIIIIIAFSTHSESHKDKKNLSVHYYHWHTERFSKTSIKQQSQYWTYSIIPLMK